MSKKNVGLLLDFSGDLVPANAAQFEVLSAFFANKVSETSVVCSRAQGGGEEPAAGIR